jgi:hypothetical protein
VPDQHRRESGRPSGSGQTSDAGPQFFFNLIANAIAIHHKRHVLIICVS